MPEREKADFLHARNLLQSSLACDVKGGSWRKANVYMARTLFAARCFVTREAKIVVETREFSCVTLDSERFYPRH